MHPHHTKHLNRLNIITGQVEAVKKMINDKRYCVDIMTQLKATRSALKAVELAVLETHMKSCLEECHNDQKNREVKISEIMTLLKKYE